MNKVLVCKSCGNQVEINASAEVVDDWIENRGCMPYIQDYFDYLTEDEREMILSRICGECWEKIFE